MQELVLNETIIELELVDLKLSMRNTEALHCMLEVNQSIRSLMLREYCEDGHVPLIVGAINENKTLKILKVSYQSSTLKALLDEINDNTALSKLALMCRVSAEDGFNLSFYMQSHPNIVSVAVMASRMDGYATEALLELLRRTRKCECSQY